MIRLSNVWSSVAFFVLNWLTIIDERPILNKKRPVNLALTTLKFPPMAIVSILHRLSGVLLVFLIPAFLFLLSISLHSEAAFLELKSYFAHPISKLFTWGVLSALIYHLLAGIRHMIMDFGFGETVTAARTSSFLLIALAIVISILVGVWLW